MWSVVFPREFWEPGWRYFLGWWFGLGLLVDMIFLLRARRRWQSIFRQRLPEPAAPRPQLAWGRGWRRGRHERTTTLGVKLRRIAVAAVALLAAGAGAVFCAIRTMHVEPPKPVIVSISQSNNPVLISGSGSFLFILPDGTLWGWGQNQIVSPPQQIGTNRDWVQASVADRHAVGARSDGTLWAWDFDGNEPKQVGSSHDWVEACAGNRISIALKRDGTLWSLDENPPNQGKNRLGPIRGEVVQVGTDRDWKAISATLFGGSRLALRADGTLWTWGNVNYLTLGIWAATNYPEPTQVCRESNWVGFYDGVGGGARAQTGESWRFFPLAGLPGPDVPVTTIGYHASSNGIAFAFGMLFQGDWPVASFETRSDGTLWATPVTWPTLLQPMGPPLRIGKRSDWVSVWGTFDTTIGLTADGTLWTWGKDYGQPAHYEFEERLGMLKEMIATLLGAGPQSSINDRHEQCREFYPQKEPRPLLRLAPTNSSAANLRR